MKVFLYTLTFILMMVGTSFASEAPMLMLFGGIRNFKAEIIIEEPVDGIYESGEAYFEGTLPDYVVSIGIPYSIIGDFIYIFINVNYTSFTSSKQIIRQNGSIIVDLDNKIGVEYLSIRPTLFFHNFLNTFSIETGLYTLSSLDVKGDIYLTSTYGDCEDSRSESEIKNNCVKKKVSNNYTNLHLSFYLALIFYKYIYLSVTQDFRNVSLNDTGYAIPIYSTRIAFGASLLF
jgi:hypothetical protein